MPALEAADRGDVSAGYCRDSGATTAAVQPVMLRGSTCQSRRGDCRKIQYAFPCLFFQILILAIALKPHLLFESSAFAFAVRTPKGRKFDVGKLDAEQSCSAYVMTL